MCNQQRYLQPILQWSNRPYKDVEINSDWPSDAAQDDIAAKDNNAGQYTDFVNRGFDFPPPTFTPTNLSKLLTKKHTK